MAHAEKATEFLRRRLKSVIHRREVRRRGRREAATPIIILRSYVTAGAMTREQRRDGGRQRSAGAEVEDGGQRSEMLMDFGEGWRTMFCSVLRYRAYSTELERPQTKREKKHERQQREREKGREEVKRRRDKTKGK